MYACVCVCIYIHKYIYIFKCGVCVCVCVSVNVCMYVCLGRDSSVATATRYGLDLPWTESRCGRDFPHPSRPALGRTQQPVHGYRLFPGCKAAGAWP